MLGYNKLCELEDFEDEALARYMRAILARDGRLQAYCPGREHRKAWEVAQAARALDELGALHSNAEILGVAAGIEETTFWLTNRARRVFATDLYLDAGGWADDAPRAMLERPDEYATCDWNQRRLVVQHMDARELDYEDGYFDGVFCSSSLEHFGDYDDVGRALGEIWRVLRPGGIASLSTEYRLRGFAPGLPGTLLFDASELDQVIVEPFAWELVGPLDLRLSKRTLATEIPLADAIASRHRRFPHIVLSEGDSRWTSVHLALRKLKPRRGFHLRRRPLSPGS